MVAIALSSKRLSAAEVPVACSGGVMSLSSQRTSLPTAIPGDAHTPASVFGSSGLPGSRERRPAPGDCVRAGFLFHFAMRFTQQFRRDRFDRRSRLRAYTEQLDSRAFAGT